MREEEAIERLKERVKLDRKIRNNKAESDYEQFCENECQAIETILNLAEKLQKKIKEYRKFKKDIVDRIMIWDKEELPKDEVIIRMLDTLMDEVSRLEDIEDKKIEGEIGFVEEKRDKYWKDKIGEVIKDLDEFDATFFDASTLKEATKKSLNDLLEEN
jgi:hypothetical protein